ncbi:hypothetical protein IIA95_03110 [Patescibacteria group bacterium]|nr:hypothetical protein [Patescibacteria group bacterium]
MSTNKRFLFPEFTILLFFAALFMVFSSVQGQSGQTTITETSSIRETLTITGTLTKGSGTFVIDHPLDPKNKLLFHSFVESPDVKNIYDGVVVLNRRGEATIKLPKYFEALNKDFRYLATPIGKPAPNLYLKRGVKRNKFILAGGPPGTKVSWQVTGIRHDPYILANPIIPEVEKGPDALVEKGEYLFEEARIKSFFQRMIDFFLSLFTS